MDSFFQFWQELYDFWIDGWQWIFETILGAFVSVLELIPVPAWATATGSLSVPDGVAWFAQALELPTGAAIMASAWGIRFLVRRLPFIG